jgi:hypothetical protein
MGVLMVMMPKMAAAFAVMESNMFIIRSLIIVLDLYSTIKEVKTGKLRTKKYSSEEPKLI